MRDTVMRRSMLALASAIVLSSGLQSSAQSPATPAASLPPAVQKAFHQAYPGATITSASPARDQDRSAFRIESDDKGRRRIVLYEPGGAVIEVADQVDEKDLPPPVIAELREHPRATYVAGLKVARGGSVEYRLTLRGSRKTALVVKPDGTVVSFK